MIDKNKFGSDDWSHLHDAVLTATWNTTRRKCSDEELRAIFDDLPTHLQVMAVEHGMNDTVFKDGVIQWLERDNDQETTYEERPEKSQESQEADNNSGIYPTEDDINSMVEDFTSNLDVSSSSKRAVKFGYQEGMFKMLEIWKQSGSTVLQKA